MTSDTPVHDFLLPRLTALVEEAVARGFARDVAVAVLIDMVTGPPFSAAATDPMTDSEPHPDYERSPDDPLLIAGVSVASPRAIGERSDADFTTHSTWQE
jgi:hypothetical protein